MLILVLMQAFAQQPLNLVCVGAGTANKVASTTVSGTSSAFGLIGGETFSAHGSSNSTIHGRRQQGFEDQVDVRLFTGDDRIRLPRSTLSLLRGGADGWFKLKNVKVEPNTISANAAVNIINNPNVYIDRRTGIISISGKGGDYRGQCEAVAADAPVKF
jgi:hypothetical protein